MNQGYNQNWTHGAESRGLMWNVGKDRGLIHKLTNVFDSVFTQRNAKKIEGDSVFDGPLVPSAASAHEFTAGGGFVQAYAFQKYLATSERSKSEKLKVYRAMEAYDEISQGIETICDDAINYNYDGEVAYLEIKRDDLVNNLNIKENLQNEWKYIKNEVLELDKNAWHWLSSFIVTGELFFEKMTNANNPKSGIRKVKKLLPDTTFPVWNDDEIVGFMSKDLHSAEILMMPPTMIAYTHFNKFAINTTTGERIALSYLESSKKAWRQLVWVEDAILIYRVTRAPERRVFNVATGTMPKGKAEAYMKKLMKEYKQKMTYDKQTGMTGGETHVQHMLSDFWFAKPNDSEGTTVDTLGGGSSLGELEDLDYFLKKLYRAMKIPETRRFDAEKTYSNYKVNDVTYQEAKFSKMVNRIMSHFIICIWDIYKTHLELNGMWKRYKLTDNDIKVRFHANNLFEEMRDADLQSIRMDQFGTMSSYIGEIYAKEFVLRKYMKLSKEEIAENRALIEKEKREGDGGGDQFGMGGGF